MYELRQGDKDDCTIKPLLKWVFQTVYKIYQLYEIENKIWNERTAEEQQQYLSLTQKYREGLKKY